MDYEDKDLHICGNVSEGDQVMENNKAGGSQYINNCKSGKDTYLSFLKAEKNIYLSFLEAGKNIFVYYIKCGDEKVNDFIEKLSDENSGLKWRDVVKLAMKGYER